MKIAIVNDSLVSVEGLRRVISSAPEHEVIWIAHDGAEAVWRCAQKTPDLLLMDLVMPVMDGVEATRKIMENTPCAILVVTATVEGNSAQVFKAMGAGALDAVNTPVLGASGDAKGKDELLLKINTIGKLIRQKKVAPVVSPSQLTGATPYDKSQGLLAIGASSGGPQALANLLSCLPKNYPVPVVIVQHVDEQFSSELASWLNKQCVLEVKLAQENDRLMPGRVLVAGTNNHLVLTPDCHLRYTPDPVEEAYRPSVDVFFNSIAANWRGTTVAVLLTGMGRDGAEGLLRLKNKGVHTIAQDEATCTVYGMPKAAVNIGAATEVLPINAIGPTVVKLLASCTLSDNKIYG